jgi:hypothetical protein
LQERGSPAVVARSGDGGAAVARERLVRLRVARERWQRAARERRARAGEEGAARARQEIAGGREDGEGSAETARRRNGE